MEIREERLAADLVLVELTGRLDPTTVAAVQQRLLAAAAAPTRGIVLDLGGIDYVSSAGLRVLLVVGKKLQERRGKLALCGVQQYVKQVLDIAGFSSLFPLCSTREAAVAALG